MLSDYQVPALPKCDVPMPSWTVNFGTDAMLAAGIRYVTGLKVAGYSPMVINMSLGSPAPDAGVMAAVDDAIAAGVIIVAAGGNAGEFGMGYPGAYAPVISVGAAGWVGEWLAPTDQEPYYRMWWLQYGDPPMLPGSGEIGHDTTPGDVYVSDFSSRALSGQELDVLAPGSSIRGPFPEEAGYGHLPWHSHGISDLIRRTGNGGTNFYFVSGTSMASPHVASVAALMLEKNSLLTQAQVESILKATALSLLASDSRNIFDLYWFDFVDTGWDTDCGGTPCDAVGAGLVQADKAVDATP